MVPPSLQTHGKEEEKSTPRYQFFWVPPDRPEEGKRSGTEKTVGNCAQNKNKRKEDDVQSCPHPRPDPTRHSIQFLWVLIYCTKRSRYLFAPPPSPGTWQSKMLRWGSDIIETRAPVLNSKHLSDTCIPKEGSKLRYFWGKIDTLVLNHV